MSANTKFQTSQQCDFLVTQEDRSYAGAPEKNIIKVSGQTGKITLGLFSSSTLLQDYWDKVAADGAASTATAEHSMFRAPGPTTITAVYYVPDAALTANDTNYATLTLQRRNSDGTNPVTVATINTAITVAPFSGNWLQWTAVPLTLTQANLSLTAGQILTVQITKTGTGVVVPAGSLQISFQLA
jgi:hypothetical protein